MAPLRVTSRRATRNEPRRKSQSFQQSCYLTATHRPLCRLTRLASATRVGACFRIRIRQLSAAIGISAGGRTDNEEHDCFARTEYGRGGPAADCRAPLRNALRSASVVAACLLASAVGVPKCGAESSAAQTRSACTSYGNWISLKTGQASRSRTTVWRSRREECRRAARRIPHRRRSSSVGIAHRRGAPWPRGKSCPRLRSISTRACRRCWTIGSPES